MHILYIQPGSGGSFYCQNCLRDLSVGRALSNAGHEVTMLPLYLPATAHTPEPEDAPIFYSAVTLYLRHKYRWMRRLPRHWFRPLDSWPVLKMAARMAGSTSANGLEDLTLSMLKGMEGQQAEELTLLAEWIEALPPGSRPDLIILSNALLAGLAERLKIAAQAPVICWLQDEHVWFDAMHDSLRHAVLRAMRADAAHIDRFIAVSEYYRIRMSEMLKIDSHRIDVVYPSLNAADYQVSDVRRKPRKIGFLSRMAASEGFHILVDAFIELRKNPRFNDVTLAATGGSAPERSFMRRQLKKLRAAGLGGDVAISPVRFSADRKGFLSELTILSVPGGATPEAFGYYAIEAMAAGVPVVLPAQGAFPEFVTTESGGVLVDEMSADKLAAALSALLDNPARLTELSRNARRAALQLFNEQSMGKCASARMCECASGEGEGSKVQGFKG